MTTRTFDKEQEEKGAKSHDVPTTVDGYVRKTPPPRMTRQRVGSSYSEWSEGGLEREKSGGGGVWSAVNRQLSLLTLGLTGKLPSVKLINIWG